MRLLGFSSSSILRTVVATLSLHGLVGQVSAQITPKQIGVDICACQPDVYEFTLNFSQTCENMDITKETPGILDTACVLNTSGDKNVTDFVPVSVSEVQIIELDQNFEVIGQYNKNDEVLQDGAKFNYTSILAGVRPIDFNSSESVPLALQVTLTGRNAAEQDLVSFYAIVYDNGCGIWPLLKVGDRAGWTVFSDLGTPSPWICPAAAEVTDAPAPGTLSDSPSATPTEIGAPTSESPSVLPTTEPASEMPVAVPVTEAPVAPPQALPLPPSSPPPPSPPAPPPSPTADQPTCPPKGKGYRSLRTGEKPTHDDDCPEPHYADSKKHYKEKKSPKESISSKGKLEKSETKMSKESAKAAGPKSEKASGPKSDKAEKEKKSPKESISKGKIEKAESIVSKKSAKAAGHKSGKEEAPKKRHSKPSKPDNVMYKLVMYVVETYPTSSPTSDKYSSKDETKDKYKPSEPTAPSGGRGSNPKPERTGKMGTKRRLL